ALVAGDPLGDWIERRVGNVDHRIVQGDLAGGVVDDAGQRRRRCCRACILRDLARKTGAAIAAAGPLAHVRHFAAAGHPAGAIPTADDPIATVADVAATVDGAALALTAARDAVRQRAHVGDAASSAAGSTGTLAALQRPTAAVAHLTAQRDTPVFAGERHAAWSDANSRRADVDARTLTTVDGAAATVAELTAILRVAHLANGAGDAARTADAEALLADPVTAAVAALQDAGTVVADGAAVVATRDLAARDAFARPRVRVPGVGVQTARGRAGADAGGGPAGAVRAAGRAATTAARQDARAPGAISTR